MDSIRLNEAYSLFKCHAPNIWNSSQNPETCQYSNVYADMHQLNPVESVDTVLLISPAPSSGLQNTLPNSSVVGSPYASNEMELNDAKSFFQSNYNCERIGAQLFDGMRKLIKVGIPEQQLSEKKGENINFEMKTLNIDSESLAWVALSQYNNAIEESVQQLNGLFEIVDNFEKDVESKLMSIQQFGMSKNDDQSSVIQSYDIFSNSSAEVQPSATTARNDEGDDEYERKGHACAVSKVKTKKRSNLPESARRIMREWLDSHLMFPYPTEKEKLEMSKLAQISLNQLNNWFINARRRPTARLAQAQKMAQKLGGGRGKRGRSFTLDSDDFEVIQAA